MVDSDAFLGAFTMDSDKGGQHVKIGPWPLGPGYRPQQPPDQSNPTILPTDYKLIDQKEIRKHMRIKWEKYYFHAAGHIPYAVCKVNGAPPLDMDAASDVQSCSGEVGNEDEESEIGESLRRGHGGRPLNGKQN